MMLKLIRDLSKALVHLDPIDENIEFTHSFLTFLAKSKSKVLSKFLLSLFREANIALIMSSFKLKQFAYRFPLSLLLLLSHSFSNSQKWFPEINHFCEGVPILLVGLKVDLRTDPHALSMLSAQGTRPCSVQQGMEVAKQIGAVKYVECSAKTKVGVQEVFDTALKEALRKKWMSVGRRNAGNGGGKKKCLIL